jgi:hypothetical protein
VPIAGLFQGCSADPLDTRLAAVAGRACACSDLACFQTVGEAGTANAEITRLDDPAIADGEHPIGSAVQVHLDRVEACRTRLSVVP